VDFEELWRQGQERDDEFDVEVDDDADGTLNLTNARYRLGNRALKDGLIRDARCWYEQAAEEGHVGAVLKLIELG
jgi:hypothetical protein